MGFWRKLLKREGDEDSRPNTGERVSHIQGTEGRTADGKAIRVTHVTGVAGDAEFAQLGMGSEVTRLQSFGGPSTADAKRKEYRGQVGALDLTVGGGEESEATSAVSTIEGIEGRNERRVNYWCEIATDIFRELRSTKKFLDLPAGVLNAVMAEFRQLKQHDDHPDMCAGVLERHGLIVRVDRVTAKNIPGAKAPIVGVLNAKWDGKKFVDEGENEITLNQTWAMIEEYRPRKVGPTKIFLKPEGKEKSLSVLKQATRKPSYRDDDVLSEIGKITGDKPKLTDILAALSDGTMNGSAVYPKGGLGLIRVTSEDKSNTDHSELWMPLTDEEGDPIRLPSGEIQFWIAPTPDLVGTMTINKIKTLLEDEDENNPALDSLTLLLDELSLDNIPTVDEQPRGSLITTDIGPKSGSSDGQDQRSMDIGTLDWDL